MIVFFKTKRENERQIRSLTLVLLKTRVEMFLSYALAELWSAQAEAEAAAASSDSQTEDDDDNQASSTQHQRLHDASQQFDYNSERHLCRRQQHNRVDKVNPKQPKRSELQIESKNRFKLKDGGVVNSHNSFFFSSSLFSLNKHKNDDSMTTKRNTKSNTKCNTWLKPIKANINYLVYMSIFSPIFIFIFEFIQAQYMRYKLFVTTNTNRPRTRNEIISSTTTSRRHIVSIFLTVLTIILLLFYKPYWNWANFLVEAQPVDNLVDSNNILVNQQSSDNNKYYNQEAPNIYSNEPQPLVYFPAASGSHESGSGEGPTSFTMRTDNGNNFKLPHDSSSWSSSISPSLITAKCWNNYQNDNDCKQINVITANNNAQSQNNDQHDDSIITPVVIFESSSTIEPAFIQPASNANNNYQSPSLMAPPYFASTYRPDGNNSVVLTRHRKPPTANDVYAAPPAGATILPTDLSYQQHSRQPSPSFHSAAGFSTQRTKIVTDGVTLPTTNEFVATPQPKKPPKTTTVGRKCRDENDEDCDEPEDNDDDDDDVDDKSNTYKADKANKGNKDNNTGDPDGDTNSDNEDDDIDNNSLSVKPNSITTSGATSKSYDSDQISNEIGSGDNGFDDDNEDDADDEDGELETSGASEIPLEQTTKLVDVETVGTNVQRPNINNIIPQQATSSSPSIVVDVEVHPTLPASFPITTTESNQEHKPNNNYNQELSSQPPLLTSSTIMADDTFRVEPVFPLSSTLASGFESAKSESSEGFTNEQQPNDQSTTTELTKDELDTFLPIPMPDGIGQRKLQNSLGRGSNTGSGESNSEFQSNAVDSSGFSEKNKFDPANLVTPVSSTTPRTLEAPWKSRPLNTHTEQWRQQQQQERQRPGRLPINDPATSNLMLPNGGSAMSISQTQQREMLPALLLYACIIILSVTAFIFIIIAFIFWRRNTARQRALMHHKANMMNGAAVLGGPGAVGGQHHQMVGSMSQASQMMANMQQPGLLSTYALTNKGMSGAMGKVTSSIVKQSGSRDNMIIAEEDEERMLSLDGEQQQLLGGQSSHKDTAGEEGSMLDDDSPTNSNNNQTRQVANGSWTTEDPTTSSESQKTIESQQNAPGFNSSSAQGGRQAYPNSLSDGRQNSSSISDSQCSPDAFSNTEQQHLHQQQQHQQQQQQQIQIQQQQPQRPPAPPPPQAQYLPPCPPVTQYPPQQPMYSLATVSSIPPQNHYQPQLGAHIDPIARYGNNNSVMFDSNFKKPCISSRSVENLHQQQQNGFIYHDQRLAHYPMVPMSSPNFQPQQTRAMMMMGSGPPHMSPPNKPNSVAFSNNIQRPYSRASLMNPSVGGLNEAYLNTNNNSAYNPIITANHTGLPRQPPFNPDDFHFASPVSSARVAVNPLATLNRRHPGLGLNRDIYSEDSSSLLTASPSLARTSSSLSFAFTR